MGFVGGNSQVAVAVFALAHAVFQLAKTAEPWAAQIGVSRPEISHASPDRDEKRGLFLDETTVLRVKPPLKQETQTLEKQSSNFPMHFWDILSYLGFLVSFYYQRYRALHNQPMYVIACLVPQ